MVPGCKFFSYSAHRLTAACQIRPCPFMPHYMVVSVQLLHCNIGCFSWLTLIESSILQQFGMAIVNHFKEYLESYQAYLRPPHLQITSYKHESGQMIRNHTAHDPNLASSGAIFSSLLLHSSFKTSFHLLKCSANPNGERLSVHSVPRKPHVSSDMLSYLHVIMLSLVF